MDTVIRLIDVGRVFDGVEVLGNVCLEVRRGELLVIMGPSGAGKSTLLNILGGLDTAYTGQVERSDDMTPERAIPFVFQDAQTLLPWKTVAGNIRFIAPQITEAELVDILEAVALSPHRNKRPSALSGGMKQRLGLARALACKSTLLLMDEPFTGLDRPLRRQMWTLIQTLHAVRGLTTVLVTHDPEEAEHLGDRVIRL